MDIEPFLASAPHATPASAARWRQREIAADHQERIASPLDDANANPDADSKAGAAAADTPLRPARDGELWSLARRSQGAALRIDFELRTSVVRQVFRRDFVYVSRLLHALQVSRRVQGLDRTCLNEALATLQRRADDVQELLERIQAQLQATLAAHAPPGAELAFARPARFQATVVSPAASRYLELLTLADDTLAHLEKAWLLGLIEPADRTALASDCRRALNGYKDLVADRRQAVGEQVRATNAQRRDDGGTGIDATEGG